jgi:hypothetical protein
VRSYDECVGLRHAIIPNEGGGRHSLRVSSSRRTPSCHTDAFGFNRRPLLNWTLHTRSRRAIEYDPSNSQLEVVMPASVMNRFNTFLLVLVVLMAGAIIAILANRAGAGPLDPPAPPASTLPQVEPRIPIDHLPFSISTPGSYFLTKDLTVGSFIDGITISASNVTLDLNGFTLDGAGVGKTAILGPVSAPSTIHGVRVSNGIITGWIGYAVGLNFVTGADVGSISVHDEAGSFIVAIFLGPDSVLHDCSVTRSQTGVITSNGDTVKGCTIASNQNSGMQVEGISWSVRDNMVEGNNTSNTAGDGGIMVDGLGSFGTVDNNYSAGNGLADISVAGTNNVVMHNHTNSAIINTGSSNAIGPSISSITIGTATNPYANFWP